MDNGGNQILACRRTARESIAAIESASDEYCRYFLCQAQQESRIAALLVGGFLKPNHQPLLGLAVGEMDQRG